MPFLNLLADPVLNLGLEPAHRSSTKGYLFWECAGSAPVIDCAAGQTGLADHIGEAENVVNHVVLPRTFLERGKRGIMSIPKKPYLSGFRKKRLEHREHRGGTRFRITCELSDMPVIFPGQFSIF